MRLWTGKGEKAEVYEQIFVRSASSMLQEVGTIQELGKFRLFGRKLARRESL